MDACKKMVRELTDEAIEIVRIFPESDFLTELAEQLATRQR